MKAYWGMEVSGQLHAPTRYPQGKNLRSPSDRTLGGPRRSSGRGGKEKNSQPPKFFPNSIFHMFGQTLHIDIRIKKDDFNSFRKHNLLTFSPYARFPKKSEVEILNRHHLCTSEHTKIYDPATLHIKIH
jgi:hypothetical protein